jgi:hypothetical protein
MQDDVWVVLRCRLPRDPSHLVVKHLMQACHVCHAPCTRFPCALPLWFCSMRCALRI